MQSVFVRRPSVGAAAPAVGGRWVAADGFLSAGGKTVVMIDGSLASGTGAHAHFGSGPDHRPVLVDTLARSAPALSPRPYTSAPLRPNRSPSAHRPEQRAGEDEGTEVDDPEQVGGACVEAALGDGTAMLTTSRPARRG